MSVSYSDVDGDLVRLHVSNDIHTDGPDAVLIGVGVDDDEEDDDEFVHWVSLGPHSVAALIAQLLSLYDEMKIAAKVQDAQ